jgi:hypothetical protein
MQSLAGAALAIVLVWRVLAAGGHALDAETAAIGVLDSDSTLAHEIERPWRARIARAPTDVDAMIVLAMAAERAGDSPTAADALGAALRLAPNDRQVLSQAAAVRLRAGDLATALPLLRKLADLHPDARAGIWPVFVAALAQPDAERFFIEAAGDSPSWWPAFFAHACRHATSITMLERLFLARSEAGTVVDLERALMIDRTQREARWLDALRLWLASLPPTERAGAGHVFDGGFEGRLSGIGFDWRLPRQEGVRVEARPAPGAAGKRALHVTFAPRRFGAPPIFQYLVLPGGRYRLEGVGRPDGLETWLGLQWGLYCVGPPEEAQVQLARSGRFAGTDEWTPFAQEFVVPQDCDAQVLRLELANPRSDADTPGKVAARMRGSVWFDDLRVVALE